MNRDSDLLKKAVHKLVDYIRYRDYSEKELKIKLSKYYSKELIEKVLSIGKKKQMDKKGGRDCRSIDVLFK